MASFDDRLDDAINRMMAGQDVSESDELRDLLAPARQLLETPVPAPPQRTARLRMNAALAAQRRRGLWGWLGLSGLPGLRPRRLIPAMALVATIVVLLLSNFALPGQWLYPVKQGTEAVMFLFRRTPAAQAAYYVQLADRRLTEMERLTATGRPVPARTLAQFQQAWAEAASIPGVDPQSLQRSAFEQSRRLQDLLPALPTDLQNQAKDALDALLRLAGVDFLTPTPTPTPTAALTSTPAPGVTPSPTPTPPQQGPPPESSPAHTMTPTPVVTVTSVFSAPTSTPTPTSADSAPPTPGASPAPSPSPDLPPFPTPTPASTPTPTRTPTPTPTATPHPSETPHETETPEPTPTSSSTPAPTPTRTPHPSHTPEPSHTPTPTPTRTPTRTHTPRATHTPEPTETAEPTETPHPTETPDDDKTKTPEPTHTPKPSETPDNDSASVIFFMLMA